MWAIYANIDFDDWDYLLTADETFICMDPPSRESVPLIGSRRVDAVSTGQQQI